MTEKEAISKWCPFARCADWQTAGGVSINRGWRIGGNLNLDDARCFASSCMMWRWNSPGWKEPKTHKPTNGYCGLGGKP